VSKVTPGVLTVDIRGGMSIYEQLDNMHVDMRMRQLHANTICLVVSTRGPIGKMTAISDICWSYVITLESIGWTCMFTEDRHGFDIYSFDECADRINHHV
jgi:hypothetical protein